MRFILFSTFFTLWGYEVSYLEFITSIASFIGVGLGITGKRITWPWWALSSALYGIFFLNFELYTSAALQLVFITAAVVGWFGWAPTGAQPGPLKGKFRIYTIATVLIATLLLGPVLKWLGAASTYFDAVLFFRSVAAQILMVYEKYETWPMWLAVNIGYVVLHTRQELLFTTVLYTAFTLMAAIGWRRWYESHQRTLRSL